MHRLKPGSHRCIFEGSSLSIIAATAGCCLRSISGTHHLGAREKRQAPVILYPSECPKTATKGDDRVGSPVTQGQVEQMQDSVVHPCDRTVAKVTP